MFMRLGGFGASGLKGSGLTLWSETLNCCPCRMPNRQTASGHSAHTHTQTGAHTAIGSQLHWNDIMAAERATSVGCRQNPP